MSDIQPDDPVDLYENAPCGLLSLTIEGRIAKLNATLASWLGRAHDELLLKPFGEALSFGGRIAYETHLAPMLRLHGEVAEIALDLLDANGMKIPVIVNAIAKVGPNGDHVSTSLSLFKALDRRRYERTLLDAREKAEQAVQAEHATGNLREQFIAVLGHDLRNPVAALGSGVALLTKEPLTDTGRFIVKEMGHSVSRAAALIDNILDFARGRLGEGLILKRDSKAPLTPVLEQVVAEIRAVFPDRNIVTNFAIAEPVDCDRQRMGQLAANLVSNAVTHGAPDQPIEVEAHCYEDSFTFSVANWGPQIDGEARAQLFQPFFRGGVRHSQQGLGLGLFIVSEIAKAHGGTINVESTQAKTQFSFSMSLRGPSSVSAYAGSS